MQNQENKREKRKLTLPQLKLIAGSAALVVLTVLLTLGLNSVFRHDEKPTHLGFEDIGELATQAAYLTIVEDIDASRELFGVKIPFTQTEIIYSYDVAVKAGLDFDQVEWELQKDLGMFMREYMQRITPDFVRLSIGLRAPQIYAETQPLIKKIPEAFVSSLAAYLGEMVQRGKLAPLDQESAALTIFASTFGYTFLSASFAQELSPVEQERYIEQSVALFIEGLARP